MSGDVSATCHTAQNALVPRDPSQTPRRSAAVRAGARTSRAWSEGLRAMFSPGGVAEAERQAVVCRHVLEHGRASGLCPGCWMLPSHCACGAYRPARTAGMRVVIHMHHNEWGVGTNTGCVIKSSLPEDCELLMRGHKEHDDRLREILEAPDMVPCILWPGADAMTPDEFKKHADDSKARCIVVVAPDASFRCARKMASKYPTDIPRVCLPPETVLKGERNSLLYPVRQYGGSEYDTGRTSTLEAVAAFLLEMGEDRSIAEAMLANMKVKMDQVLIQSGRKAIYGTASSAREGARLGESQGGMQLADADRHASERAAAS